MCACEVTRNSEKHLLPSSRVLHAAERSDWWTLWNPVGGLNGSFCISCLFFILNLNSADAMNTTGYKSPLMPRCLSSPVVESNKVLFIYCTVLHQDFRISEYCTLQLLFSFRYIGQAFKIQHINQWFPISSVISSFLSHNNLMTPQINLVALWRGPIPRLGSAGLNHRTVYKAVKTASPRAATTEKCHLILSYIKINLSRCAFCW